MIPLPTSAEFKARHPRFATVADAVVDSVLTEAARAASEEWGEGDYRDAILNLTAHILIEEGATSSGAGSDIANTTGPVHQIEAGGVKVTFDLAASRLSGDRGATYGSTVYGRRYLDILRRNTAGAVFVV